jgi:CRP-like cAMP-binding protein
MTDALPTERSVPDRAALAPGDGRPSVLNEVLLARAAGDGRPSGLHEGLLDGGDAGPPERPPGVAYILQEDPELAEALPSQERETAFELLWAPTISTDGDSWRCPHCDPSRTYGLLMLEGLLGRRLRLGRATSLELLGSGDVLRPWQEAPESTIATRVDWRVFAPARLAVLDERITALIGLRPELAVALAGRLVRRSYLALYLATIGHIRRVDDRLWAALWHIGGSWGRMTLEGVRIPFYLSHAALGEIVGAQRPTVTIGMKALQDDGKVKRTQDGFYVLTGSPPDWMPTN